MTTREKQATRALIVGDLNRAVAVVQETTQKEEMLLKMWKFLFEFVGVLLVLGALKVVSFVSFWKAHYRDFIAFIDKYRSMTRKDGTTAFGGPSGLMLALSLQNNILQLFMPSPYLAEALFYLYSTPSLNAVLTEPGGENVLQNMFEIAIAGTPDTPRPNANQIVCLGIRRQFTDFNEGLCGSVCDVAASNASMTIFERMVNNVSQSGTNGGMIGHMVGSAASGFISAGPMAVIGLVVGCTIGVAQSFLQDKQAKDICAAGRTYCARSSC